MNRNVLNTVIQDFINTNLESDITKLLLRNSRFKRVTTKELVNQIEAKKKSKTKLPTWFKTDGIFYPNKLNIEQTSSEVTAAYKSQLISGESLIDLTGGFGVDSYFFSQIFKHVTHCEINAELTSIVKHNYEALDITNVHCINDDGLNHLKQVQKDYDWIYVDPSRRHDTKGKVFFLKDCLPNIPEHLELLFSYSNNIMIKTSPLLDIKAGLKELESVKKIHVVAIDNDVKELLWVLEKGYSGIVDVKTVNLKKSERETFSFQMQTESIAEAAFSEPLSYLYEPNSAILKSGAFKLVSQELKVSKLQTHSHLYTSSNLIDFPGRRFKIDKTIPYNKKLLKKEFVYRKANVSTRNFPESVEQLKKKFDIRDGGTIYLFFTTDLNTQKVVLVCSKV